MFLDALVPTTFPFPPHMSRIIRPASLFAHEFAWIDGERAPGSDGEAAMPRSAMLSPAPPTTARQQILASGDPQTG
jgi:hypothetical protein